MTFRSASTSAKHRPVPARADGQHHQHKVIAPLLNKYGKMIITIGFALGDLKMPMFRKPIPIFDGGIYAGVLDPTHYIRIVGLPSCSHCSGIGENHSGACAENKAIKMKSFLERKKKLTEANRATPTKSNTPIRRGKHGGLREIERKILKENMN